MQAIGDDTAVDIGFIKNCARQTRFTTGNVRHRVEQMGRKADACAEADFGFFDRCIGVTRRNHDTGINQFGDDLYRDHFWCQCDFGDHICIIAQEINQRSVRLTDKSRIMGAFFHKVQPRAFKMKS